MNVRKKEGKKERKTEGLTDKRTNDRTKDRKIDKEKEMLNFSVFPDSETIFSGTKVLSRNPERNY
jgi:hypothetical protein